MQLQLLARVYELSPESCFNHSGPFIFFCPASFCIENLFIVFFCFISRQRTFLLTPPCNSTADLSPQIQLLCFTTGPFFFFSFFSCFPFTSQKLSSASFSKIFNLKFACCSISQGGILGVPLIALSQDITRGTFGVPGGKLHLIFWDCQPGV